jgi:uncharacterized protein (DUF2345 family)
MTINLQVGGVYADAEGNDHRITHLSAIRLFVSDRGYTFCANGQKYASVKSHYDLIRVISEPDAPTEAPAPDGVTVTTKVTQIEVCAPETETLQAGEYSITLNADGDILLAEVGASIYLSPAAARAIGAELIRMGGE